MADIKLMEELEMTDGVIIKKGEEFDIIELISNCNYIVIENKSKTYCLKQEYFEIIDKTTRDLSNLSCLKP